MRLQIQKLDPTTLRPGQVLLFCGRRGSGKSHCLRFIMHAMKDHFDLACAMTPTVSSQEMFAELMPRSLIYPELREDVIENMLKLNRELALKNKTKSILLIFDDLSYDKSIFRTSKVLLDLAKNGRHCMITCGAWWCKPHTASRPTSGRPAITCSSLASRSCSR